MKKRWSKAKKVVSNILNLTPVNTELVRYLDTLYNGNRDPNGNILKMDCKLVWFSGLRVYISVSSYTFYIRATMVFSHGYTALTSIITELKEQMMKMKFGRL